MRGNIRLKHYSIRTKQTYVDWIKRFILHFDKRHPRGLGAAEVRALLTRLEGTHWLMASPLDRL